MAAKKNQTENGDELGGLPSELMTDGQSQVHAQVLDNELNNQSEAEQLPDSAEPLNPKSLAKDPDPDEHGDTLESKREVVVRKGFTVRHNGDYYRQHTRLRLAEVDAARLIDIGVVSDMVTLRAQAQAGESPAVSVITPDSPP